MARCFLSEHPAETFGLHGEDGFGEGQEAKRLFNATRWFGLPQEGEQLADFAQFLPCTPFFAVEGHTTRHALDRSEEVAENRHLSFATIFMDNIFEQEGWPAFMEYPLVDFGHLAVGRDFLGNPHQITVFLKPFDEITQGCVGSHGRVSVSGHDIARQGGRVTMRSVSTRDHGFHSGLEFLWCQIFDLLAENPNMPEGITEPSRPFAIELIG